MSTSGRNVFLPLLFSTRSLPFKLRNVLYQSMVQPHLDYCWVVWAECCKQDASRLESIQNNGIQLILNERWDCPSSEMRSKLGWTTLANRKKLLRAKYTRRCLCGQGPKYTQCMFTTNEKMGLRSTRHLKDIYLPSHKTNWLAKSFIYCASQDWNDLPLSLREASEYVFKTNIKSYFKD